MRDPFPEWKKRPRLMADEAAIKRVVKAIGDPPKGDGAKLLQKVIDRAEEATRADPPQRDNTEFLQQARHALRRLQALGLIWLLGKREGRYLERAKLELRTICGFRDWNPSHFLDTAEMTHAVAIGLDWFYNDLEDGEVAACVAAIVEKGLKPGKAQLVGTPKPLWPAQSTNWNIVCNASLIIGVLAVAKEDHPDPGTPELLREVFERCVDSVPTGFDGYSPDGSWDEGPGYWAYATEYAAYLISALETSIEHSFGLARLPGFRETGQFRMYAEGAAAAQDQSGLFFNYSDCDEERPGSWCMRWLSYYFDDAMYNAVALKNGQSRPMDLLWFSTRQPSKGDKIPRNKLFRGIANVAMLRGRSDQTSRGFRPWVSTQSDDVYVGIRAGTNSRENSHGQLDLGSFVLDALGVRWATDIPPIAADKQSKYTGDYDLPGYFDMATERRFRYYRTGTSGHNTLVINGFNQPLGVWTEIVGFRDDAPQLVVAVLDLTSAYPDCLRTRRGFALIDDRHVLIVDEFTPKQDLTAAWQMHTRATIHPDVDVTDNVELNHYVAGQRDPKRFFVRILQPADLHFKLECALVMQPKEAPHPGICKLVATMTSAEPARIAVYLSSDPIAPDVKLPDPLDKPLWKWLDWAGEKRRAEKKLRWKQAIQKVKKKA